MGTLLRLLVIEDSEADFALHVRNLDKHGLAAACHRVETYAALEAALEDKTWDAVLSDYSLPGMDFPRILALLQARLPGVPLILVSGSIGEEAAVDLLREGVWDFVWKDRPGRLAQALTHCLEEARTRNARLATETALRLSESRYRSLFENMLDGYARCRLILEGGVPADWVYLDVNSSFERLTGLKDAVGCKASEILPGLRETNSDLLERYGRVVATGVPERFEAYVDQLDRWFSVSVYSPAPGEFVAVFDNITDRKETERSLQEAHFRLTMALGAGRFGVWDRDLASGITLWDEQTCRIFGVLPGIPGRTMADFIGLIHPEDREPVTETIKEALRRRSKLKLYYRIVRPDGTLRNLHALGLVLCNEAGEAVRLLGLVEDVTERVEAEEARRESEEMFLSLAEGVTDALCVHDGEGRILAVNQHACDSLGYTKMELLGLTLADLDEDFDLAKARVTLAAIQPGQGQTLLGRHRRKDGGTFPVEVLVSCLEIHGRRVYIGLARDISERVKAEAERRLMEDQVHHAEKLDSLGSLASGVAHDMNNILAAILAVTQVLRLKLEEDPGLVSALDTIIKAANRGRDLVRGLTNFARKDLRAAEPLDLNRIVQDEADLLNRTLRQKIRLEVGLERPLPLFQGEAGKFGSALMNLCVNAVDAMPDGGTLALRTRNLHNGWLELSVQDTGAGMAPEVLNRAMEPFFTTKELGKGTGLGLAMVHGTVKAHGGSLEIRSQLGEGTRIIIRLPALAEADLASSTLDLAQAKGRKSLKVLLVDDDELIQATVPLLLHHLGHQPTTAMSGEEGLARLAGGLAPDLVILDLNMPGLGGEATFLRIRQGYPHLPVLIATGFMDPSTTELLQGDPWSGSISKPFSIDELSRKLEGLQVH